MTTVRRTLQRMAAEPVAVALLCAIGVAASGTRVVAQSAVAPAMQTRAEVSAFTETSTEADVARVADALRAASPHLRVSSFGTTEEGRSMPLLVLSNPAVDTPEAARALKRPIIFVFANIHAGEVEGKEATLILARRLLVGDLAPLLTQAVVILAPNYNADGNEKIDVKNRTAQNGPVSGVGTRENSKRLDLNRDFLKLEAAESRALVGAIARWDPHLTMDLHATNGSYHAYHLTYAPAYNPNTDARLVAMTRDTLLPEMRKALADQHGFRSYYYGNFTSSSQREWGSFDPEHPGDTVWATFDHRPRFGTNYVGLRNRLVILSEAYSYLDFERRVKVTEAFVEQAIRAVIRHGDAIRALTTEVDRETATAFPGKVQGLQFEPVTSAQPVEILVGRVTRTMNERSGKEMAQMTDEVRPFQMKEQQSFAPTRSLTVPRGWVIPKSAIAAFKLEPAIERLKMHGLVVRTIDRPVRRVVERFDIATLTRSERVYQGRRAITLTGAYAAPATQTIEAGSVVIDATQRLARLAFYLLEPESDDGLVVWNFIDEGLAPGVTYPILRLAR